MIFKNKYSNKKTVINNIKFDSKKEANRYSELLLMEKCKMIKNLQLQPKFLLLEGYVHEGKKIRDIHYIADFQYYDNEKKKEIIEDSKGMKTEVYKLKKKIFIKKYILNLPNILFLES